jgi:hypothetical protein
MYYIEVFWFYEYTKTGIADIKIIGSKERSEKI